MASIGGGEVFVTLALADGHLRLGAGVAAGGSLGPGHPELTLSADAAIVDVPLAGAGAAVVLPQAAVLVRATGPGGGPLLDVTSPQTVRIGSLDAGIVWNGTDLAPTLVLLDNTLDTQALPRLDLTNADSVAEAATAAVVSEITSHLGAAGAGRRLAAIAGLVPPEDPANPGTALPGWGHALKLADFVVSPATAIGAYHRAVLLDGASWAHLLREITLLIGLGEVSAAAGTPEDPWAVTIAADGGTQLELAAWHQPSPADPAVQQLRIGLRLAAAPGGATVELVSEVLTFDLPASGPASLGLLGAQEFRFILHPAVDAHLGPAALSLDTLAATAGWRPGGSLGWQIRAQGLSVSVDGDSVTVGELHLPPAAAFDFTDLESAASGLGLTLADLTGLIRMVLVLLAEQAGPAAELGAALLGLHAHLPGLSEDSPLLIDPADPGLVLRDPLGAVRAWLGRLTMHVGPAGQASLAALLRTIGSLGSDLLAQLGTEIGGGITDLDGTILGGAELALTDLLTGAGTFDDPWRVAWPGAASPAAPGRREPGRPGPGSGAVAGAGRPAVRLAGRPARPGPAGQLARGTGRGAARDRLVRPAAAVPAARRGPGRAAGAAGLPGGPPRVRGRRRPARLAGPGRLRLGALDHRGRRPPPAAGPPGRDHRGAGPDRAAAGGRAAHRAADRPQLHRPHGLVRPAGLPRAPGQHRPGRPLRPAHPGDRSGHHRAGRRDRRRRLLHRRSGGR